jgi:hypothetical protein
LNIGCAGGIFLHEAAECGITVGGIEYNPQILAALV